MPIAAVALVAASLAPVGRCEVREVRALGGIDRATLPPELPWAGASRALIAPPKHPWRTPAEADSFARTPSYDVTIAWLRRLCAASPDFRLTESMCGDTRDLPAVKTSEGRTIWTLIAARGAEHFEPRAVRALGRPIVFVQAGIHAGEIDGKDAGLMLLRDMLPGGRLHALLDRVSLVFVPVLNVDGHEHAAFNGRLNQRGPDNSGWRTNGRNLNLNRDYTKLDAPEMVGIVTALNAWDPDLYLDLHVTDGGDYQYDVTWIANGAGGWSPSTRAWIDATLTPAITAALDAQGHVGGPFGGPVDDADWSRGYVIPTMEPRFSNGYGDARHIPAILVENHSLKRYERRVLGTYVLLESALRTVAAEVATLRAATVADRKRHAPQVALAWRAPAEASGRMLDWRGIASRQVQSAVTGATYTEWLGTPVAMRLPRVDQNEPVRTVRRPAAYWVPAAWTDVIARLRTHGILVEEQPIERSLEVEMLFVESATLDSVPFEGRVRVTPRVDAVHRRQTFTAGSVRVPTRQPSATWPCCCSNPNRPIRSFSGVSSTRRCGAPNTARRTFSNRWPMAENANEQRCWPIGSNATMRLRGRLRAPSCACATTPHSPPDARRPLRSLIARTRTRCPSP